MKYKTETYKSILVMVVGLCLIGYLFGVQILYFVSFGIAFFSLIHIKIAESVEKIWFKIGEVLGHINSRIILGIVFFIFLTPIAFLYRIFTKQQTAESDFTNFKTVNKSFSKDSFKKMF